ncbi:MAG: dockerin type I domain-containing protein [Candidatus Saccharibacteria bacterium]
MPKTRYKKLITIYKNSNTRLIAFIFILVFASIGYVLLGQSRAATSLSADFNSDSTVNIYDLSILASNWGKTAATKATGDANSDGTVNIYDLSILASQWGQTATPTPTPTITPTEAPPTFYVKNGGNDSLDGLSDATAWATVAKVNSHSFSPGQSVGFKCGDTWREKIVPASSGSAAGQITYRSYGTGAKPKFFGGFDLSSSSGWTEYSTNKWRWTNNNVLATVALYMNDEALHGTQKAAISDLTKQGDFCYVSNYTYLYSTSNPGTHYENIESALYQVAAHLGSRSYITVSSLDFRYWGQGGLTSYPSTNHIYEYNDVSWIGPGLLSQPWGNGIGGQGTSNDIIRYNHVHQCIDAGLSTINYNTDGTLHSNAFYGNVVSNCEYGYEQQMYDTGDYNNVHITGNIFYKMGDTIWHDIRVSNDKWGMGLQSWNPVGHATDCVFDNNIVYGSVYSHLRMPTSGWAANGNRYYPDGSTMFRTYNSISGDFAAWQAAGHDSTGSLISAISGTDEEIIAALEAMMATIR